MKKTILGLCVGLMIGLASNAFAAVGDKVEAIFTEFVFVVDGEQKTLDAQPVVINGSSYLPVRTVANLLGKDVTYKADSRTIELNTPDTVVIENVVTTETILQEIEKVNSQIADVQKSIDWYQGKIDRIKGELQAYGKSAEEIASEPVLEQYQGAVDLGNKSLAELEAKKAELEAQQPLQE